MAQTIKDLFPQTPYAAKFYGIPKLHKETPNRIPLRPIVLNVGTITWFLVAWLEKYLQPYAGTFSDDHVRNNVDFKNKLMDFARINNYRSDTSLYSLDVESLFTMVPLDDV